MEFERQYYSVPYRLIGKSVDLRISTEPEHRPERHRAVIELNHERLLERAECVGPATASLLREQVHRRAHPDEALRLARDLASRA